MRAVWVVTLAACSYPDTPPCPFALSYAPTVAVGGGSASDIGSAGGFPDSLVWSIPLAGTSSLNLGVQLYSGGGAGTPDWPGSGITPKQGITLPSNDAYVFIGAGPIDAPNPYYLSVTGTLNITSVSPSFTGATSDLTLQHYDSLTMADPDMCTARVSAFTFDVPLQ